MNRFLSQKIRFYTFTCITLLLYVHGYNLNETYLIPFSTVSEPLTFTTFLEYLLANGLLRFRIPLLFLISGYIFALQDKKPYDERIKRRFITLIIPFFIWSAISIGVTYLWQQHPVTAQAVKDSQLDQLGDNRPYNEIGWQGVLFRWAVRPPSFQLWFIRSLFIYNVLYPVIKWAVTKYPAVWFGLVLLFWHTIFSFFFVEGLGLFFFSFGVWLNKRNYPIHKKPAWFSHYLSWLFFIGLCIIKTFMAFELEPGNYVTNIVLYALHDVSLAAGILAIWFSGNALVKWAMKKKYFVAATSYSFVLYALHVPLIHYTMRLAFIYMRDVPNYRLITYVFLPAIIFCFCLAVGVLLKKMWPTGYRIATGGRGF